MARVLSSPARCAGSLPWPRRWRSPTAPSRPTSSRRGCAGSRPPRPPSGSSPCVGTGAPTGWWPPHRQGRRLPSPTGPPRRGGRQVPLPLTLPRLLLGHRRPGRAGLPHLRRRGTPLHPSARAAAPVRLLRPLRPAGLAAGVLRSGPRHPAQGRGAGIDTNHHSNDREVIETYPTTWTTHSCSTTRGSRWWAAAGPAASWPRASAASSMGGNAPLSWSTTTGWSPTTCCARFFRGRRGKVQEPGPTGVPSATPSIPSRRRTPAPLDTAIPAFPPTATPCSSAAPKTPPRGGQWPRACRATRAGGSSTRATKPTGGRSWSATSPTRFPGTNPPPDIRRWFKPKANLGPRMRASVRSCRCYPLR